MRAALLVTLLGAACVQGCAHAPTEGAPAWLGAAPSATAVRGKVQRDEVCTYEIRTGTRFKEWVCVPRQEYVSREERSVEMLRAWQRGH
jgi:hypothetical protein